MPIFIISIVIQVLFVLHVIKTGRNTTWIFIVIFLPFAGIIAYFIVEVLPDLAGSRTGRTAKRTVLDIINPNKDLNLATSNYSITDTVENSLRLARECLEKGLFAEANELFNKCLTGVHSHDPEYKNQDAHLLYAKSLKELGELKQAKEEFEILDSYYSGPEPTYHLAMLYKDEGENGKAMELLKKIVHKSTFSGGHYNKIHKKWIKLAKNEYRG